MQRLFDLIAPVVVSVGVFLLAATVIAAVVRTRLVRGLVMAGGFVVWAAWMVDYTSQAIVS